MMYGKKMLAGFLMAVMVVTGVLAVDFTTEATTTPLYGEAGSSLYEDQIQYKSMTDETLATTLTAAWTAKTAPIMKGYVFGGWCTQNTDGTTYTMLDADGVAGITDTATVYAKFVPAYVLSVKAQVDEDTETFMEERTEKGSIRLISSVDSKDYQKVGFKVLINNKNELFDYNEDTQQDEPLETTTIYTGLKKSANDENAISAEKIFGTQSKFLSVWRLDDIAATHDAKIINVTPYWITLDGTKVMGITKYVHMEDGYQDHAYISVPVKINGEIAVAGGTLTVTYPTDVELVPDKVEFDGLFSTAKMKYYDDGNGTITFVGNGSVIGEDVSPDGIYANLRFQKTSESTYKSCTGEFLDFSVENEKFCNWAEDIVDVSACDIQY